MSLDERLADDYDALHDEAGQFKELSQDRAQVLARALAVIILAPLTRAFLESADPKALEQARSALGLPEIFYRRGPFTSGRIRELEIKAAEGDVNAAEALRKLDEQK